LDGGEDGRVRRLAGDLAHHPRAHVLKRILEIDLLRDRDSVLRDERPAELAIDRHVAAPRTERDLDYIRELVHPSEDCLPRFFAVNDAPGHASHQNQFRKVTPTR
jgi:hypothetical protein